MEHPCTTTTTLLIDITNGHELIAACQKRWGSTDVKLMSAGVERPTASVDHSTVEWDLAQLEGISLTQR